ncbi:MAG: response regulator [Hungatella hathewayi]|nr:response regulator [Hungatella hathewayi]
MYRLLIADDEMIERAVLYKTLKENLGEQCEIFQAENGREALRIYEEEKIQIAILDIEMPGINGIGAAEKIRETDKDCCIIFLTAFDEFAYAKKAITVRALDYLLKPYNDEELILVVEEAMRLAGEREREKEALEQERAGASDGIGVESGDAGDSEDTTSEEEPEEAGNVRLSKVAEMITQYIRENYMYDLSMQDVARMMNYSEAYFCKLFKQCFNRNFTSYLTEYRVEEAKKMLAEPTVNVKEIGKAVGYSDSNYFAKVFKRITGQSPTEYRLDIFQKG